MYKEFRDYQNFYIGCPAYWQEDGIKSTYPMTMSYIMLENADWVKPIIRPLNNMTEDEKKELWQLIFKREFGKNGNIIFFEAKNSTPTRWVLMSGVDRLGIENDGNIWADSDLHNYRFNQHEVTKWLLAKRFDLFGLIPAGLAIDATILDKNENTIKAE